MAKQQSSKIRLLLRAKNKIELDKLTALINDFKKTELGFLSHFLLIFNL